ncbi:MAG: DUF1573 domain-containing protein [Planctomycetota bacterium]
MILLPIACQPRTAARPPQGKKPTVVKPSPRISFEKKVHNFGELGIMEKDQCEFRFKNTGTALLKIGEITASCGCTVPSLSKKEYQPGEEGIIEVKYNGKSKPGPVAERIFVPTNDPANRKITLMVTAKVVQQVEVAPERFQLSLSKDNAGIPHITLKSRDGRPFSIKSYVSSDRVVSLDFDPKATASEFILKAAVDMQQLKQHRHGTIRIDLTHPRCSSVTLFYSVTPRFKAQPRMITLYNAKPNEPQIAEVVIRSTDNEQFEIDSISSRNGYMEVLSQQPVGRTIKLKLQITPPAIKAGQLYFSDTLTVRIKKDEELTIPCTGLYRPVAKDKPAKANLKNLRNR